MLAAYAVLVLMAFAAMLAMSYWANAVLSASDRLPMQWGLDGKPTWTAPG